MQCRYHPDREARVVCQKMGVGYCRECLDQGVPCADPTEYCKFRPQCIIHALAREREKEERAAESAYMARRSYGSVS